MAARIHLVHHWVATLIQLIHCIHIWVHIPVATVVHHIHILVHGAIATIVHHSHLIHLVHRPVAAVIHHIRILVLILVHIPIAAVVVAVVVVSINHSDHRVCGHSEVLFRVHCAAFVAQQSFSGRISLIRLARYLLSILHLLNLLRYENIHLLLNIRLSLLHVHGQQKLLLLGIIDHHLHKLPLQEQLSLLQLHFLIHLIHHRFIIVVLRRRTTRRTLSLSMIIHIVNTHVGYCRVSVWVLLRILILNLFLLGFLLRPLFLFWFLFRNRTFGLVVVFADHDGGSIFLLVVKRLVHFKTIVGWNIRWYLLLSCSPHIA
mmetsp:Transcript_22500/g.35992  ORF Transcript_22500/g.35992 Transcript_22500/m.35992 type:complete len:317 (-) Transcript_22500:584-1534(-)